MCYDILYFVLICIENYIIECFFLTQSRIKLNFYFILSRDSDVTTTVVCLSIWNHNLNYKTLLNVIKLKVDDDWSTIDDNWIDSWFLSINDYQYQFSSIVTL